MEDWNQCLPRVVIPMNDFRRLFIITKFELHRMVRSWRSVVCFVMMILLFILAYPTADIGRTPEEYIHPFIASVILVISVYSAITFSDSISDEFEKGTGLVMLVQPMRRSTLFFGKYFAAFNLGVLFLIFYYFVVTILCMLNWGGEFPSSIGSSFMISVLFLFSVLGVCGFISCLSPYSSLSLVVCLLVFVISSFYFDIVSLSFEPWYILTYDSQIIPGIIQGAQTIFESDMTTHAYCPLLSTSIEMMLLYGGVSIALALVIFRYREI